MTTAHSLLLALIAGHAFPACLISQTPEQVSGRVTCADCVITLDTVLTIGGLDGPGLHLITELSRVAVDRRGRILISDPRMAEISVFDSAGTFLRTVGSRGEGPGEYETISYVRVGPRYIHIFEYHAGRTMLDHDFEVVRTDRFPGQVHIGVVMPNDDVVFADYVPTPGTLGHKLHILDTAGEIVSIGADGSVYPSQLNTWTSPRSIVVGSDDGLWVVRQSTNRLVRWDLSPKPRVDRMLQRRVPEFDKGSPSETRFPRSWVSGAMLDDRGLWILWHSPDPDWKERVSPGEARTPAPDDEVYDGWLDLVDPATGRTLARHHQDAAIRGGFAEGSSYLVVYHENEAGVPYLRFLKPRLSRRLPDGKNGNP